MTERPQASLHFPPNPTTHDIFCARVFEEPFVPIGAEPTPAENAAFAAALLAYAEDFDPDDFSRLTGFLKGHPESPWNMALLTNLGLAYYRAGYYSRALDAWSRASDLAWPVTDPAQKPLADRAIGELAYMLAKLGRMTELGELLKAIEGRTFCGPATERIFGARGGLANMLTRPEISFRCGPLALHRIKLAVDPHDPQSDLIDSTASTSMGFSLQQVGELSRQLGLNYQMAFRDKGAAFIAPAVVHFHVDHFAALFSREEDRYLLQDPTFKNDAWVTTSALEAEASGYFLVPPGELPTGWRSVEETEAKGVCGKGNVAGPPEPPGPCDHNTNPCQPCPGPTPGSSGGGGMPVASIHLLDAGLTIGDEPVGYSPPVGPAMRFTVRYNKHDDQLSSTFNYSNFGLKWTFDWLAFIYEDHTNLGSDVKYYIAGGGNRKFTFDTTTKTFAHQLLDQTKLVKTTTPDSYEMTFRDGARMVFDQSDGGLSSKRYFLTKVIDPFGNAVVLSYDNQMRIASITDAIGQITNLVYELAADTFKITKVIDPFGRTALFGYDTFNRLSTITDAIGLTSEFIYEGISSDSIVQMNTPYGTTTFTEVETTTFTEEGTALSFGRSLEILYPDGEKERVEFNQNALGTSALDPPESVPRGMKTRNELLNFRNTFHWDRQACAHAYGDYTKARLYHWLHSTNMHDPVGILESVKLPLEGRVWYEYAGQGNGPIVIGSNNKPAHIGRVLDDGSTQLFTYEYNDFGNVTETIDPLGRTFSYIYDANDIDLLETRQTRAGRSELLSKMTYNTQHRPQTVTDAAGQGTIFTYNARGQVATETDALGATTTYHYDAQGYRKSVDGPLPGVTNTTTWTYDAVGRIHTKTDVSGYTLTFDYDDLDRLTKISFPDGTFDQFTYALLDRTLIRDRAGRQTTFEYNSIRQMTKRTDPLNRATLFQWCKCGALKSLTDPMGRTTTWRHDIQGRVKCKEYPDDSKVIFRYEEPIATGSGPLGGISRLRQRIDEKLQVTQYAYNLDDTLSRITYSNATVATPPVAYTYEADYSRLRSMTDGTGTTLYSYIPITGAPALGAGQLASVEGPLPNDAITFEYDELGRRVSTAVNGVASSVTYDAAGRIITSANALGVFNNTYDGNSFRKTSQSYPNGQSVEFGYAGNLQDQHLQKITNKLGITPISEFLYDHDVPTGQITSWSQQAGAETPSIYGLAYDVVDQLVSTSVSEGGNVVRTFGYSYDPASNRLTERIDGTARQFSYNALNELTSVEGDASPAATYQWDAEHRLISVTSENRETQFTYDGVGRRVGIRQLVNDAEVSNRRFVWCDNEICEERAPAGIVSKRFFGQGVKLETGVATGKFYYTRDHLGSVRETSDSTGNVWARYSYEPFGRRTGLMDIVDTDFGFANMFWTPEASLNLTKFRAYDASIGRWLSRDLLSNVELEEGPNLFDYVHNNPINAVDPLGLTYEVCCPSGSMPKTEPVCEERAGAALILCIREAVEIEPGYYRDYRAQKCHRNYRIAVNACPKICSRDAS